MSTKANIVIEQGSTFSVPITLTDQNGEDLDVTTLTARAELRKYYNATTSWSFSTSLANGCLTLSMTAEATANIAAGRYVYDVTLTDTSSNNVSRLVEGICTINPAVTHD